MHISPGDPKSEGIKAAATHRLSAIYRGSETPLDAIDGWSFNHFGLAEDSLNLKFGGNPNSLEFLANNAAAALTQLVPDELPAGASANITYITRGKIASIFRICTADGDQKDGIIASIARNLEANPALTAEYRRLEHLHAAVYDHPFFSSSATATFHTPRLLGLVEGDGKDPSVYFAEQLTAAYAAHLLLKERGDLWGFTTFELQDSSRQKSIEFGDDLSLGVDSGLQSSELRLARNRGKQALEDLAYYLLGAALLTDQVICADLSWGSVMLELGARPKLYLVSFDAEAQKSKLEAVSKQFLFLAQSELPARFDPEPVYPRRVLLRALDKFVSSELFSSSCISRDELLSQISNQLRSSSQSFLLSQLESKFCLPSSAAQPPRG